jgi:signal transduction histidine kinase
MSHELRTPLNHMIGFNELLIEDTGLSSMQRAYITAALNSAKGLLSMIDNILEYSRLEGSVIPLDAIDFDLYDMLDDVVDALRKQAVFYGTLGVHAGPSPISGLTLVLALCAGVDVVYRLDLKGISTSRMVGDPHRLSQMIKHLVDNAIKSYDGQRRGDGYNGSTVSAVEIRVQFANKRLWNRKGDPRADIGMAKWSEASLREGVQVGTLTIEVEDRGKGIPEREMKKLFSPFGQVESRGKSDGIGTPMLHRDIRLPRVTDWRCRYRVCRLGVGNRQAVGRCDGRQDQLHQRRGRGFHLLHQQPYSARQLETILAHGTRPHGKRDHLTCPIISAETSTATKSLTHLPHLPGRGVRADRR